MANGILASATLAAQTYTSIYGPPTSTFSVVTVSIVNKNTDSISVRLAVAQDPAIPTVGDYLEYNAVILPGGVLERSGIVIQNGRTFYAYSSGVSGTAQGAASNTDIVVYGIETATA